MEIDENCTGNQEVIAQPLLVRGTGPVDAANYPIFEFQSEKKQIDTSFTPKTLSERDLDCINNENPYLPKNEKNAHNDINREFALGERGFLKPGICTKSPENVLHIYGLVDSVRPYHLKQAQEAHQRWIWISGSIVATKEEAEYPSIDEDDPLHRMHEVGYFKQYETVQFTEKSGGNIMSEIGTGEIIRGYDPNIDDNHSNPWNIDGRGQLREGQFLVRIGDEYDARVIDTKLYDIQRMNTPTSSPLKNLFHIKVTPESSFMAWKLRDILVDIGIAHDWLTVTIIAEYLPFCYQRDIYFDSKRFEEIIHERDEWNEFQIVTESVRNACRRSMNYPWPDDEGYYQSKILEIGQYEISTAAPHPLLSQNPRLPQITLSGRAHIGLVAKRLDTALKPSTNLYGYQLHTVLWCHELERSISEEQTLCVGSNDLRFCSGSNCAVYVNPDNTYSAARKSRSIEPRIVKYGGGVISDDVGLGKTLTMLSLMAVHPRTDIDHNSSTTNSVKKDLGPNGDTLRCDATLVVAPSHLIHQWKDEIDRHFHEDTFTVITITLQKEFQKISYRDVLDADVVLISAAFLRTASLYDRNRRYALNWRMRREHANTKKDAEETKGTEQPRRRSTRIKKMKELQKIKVEQQRQRQYQNVAKKAPFLDLLHWRRIILDEGHELLLDNPLRETIFALSSDFKWYCTATPFPQKQLSMDYAAEFLEIRLNGKFVEWTNQKGSISVLHNVIHHHLYSKQTKESISADNHLPDIHETCKLIDFHPIERLLYDTNTMLKGTRYENRELERAICSGALDKLECGLYKSWRQNLLNFGEDVRTFFVSNGRYKGTPFADLFGPGLMSLVMSRALASEKRKYKLKLKEPISESQLDEYGRKVREPIELSVREFLKLNQGNCARILAKLRQFRRDIEYLKNQRVPELKQYQKGFDEMKQRFKRERRRWDVDVAWPNHLERKKYTECHAKLRKVEKWIAMWEEGMEIWPSIQTRLHQNIGLEIKQFEQDITASPRGDVLLDIMKKYGSKQALLLQFIQQILEDPNSRIIIFSLFGELLRILKKRLKMIKVDAGLCRGNVIARKKAMRAFQQEITTKKSQRVILLSSKDAASGADLKFATHIILVDPVPGSASESFAAERQAIGRAVRQGMDERGIATKVIRLVIRDTIEQETHERNERVREQQNNDGAKAKGVSNTSALALGLNVEDRTNDEIEFFLNIRSLVEQQRNVVTTKKQHDRLQLEHIGLESDDSGDSDEHWKTNSEQRMEKDGGEENGWYEVEEILEWRMEGGEEKYLVKWEGYDDPADNTWEPLDNLLGNVKFEEFLKRKQQKHEEDDQTGLMDGTRICAVNQEKKSRKRQWNDVIKDDMTDNNRVNKSLEQIKPSEPPKKRRRRARRKRM